MDVGASETVERILRTLPDFRAAPADDVGPGFWVIETPLLLPDGDSLPLFFDGRRNQFTDLGETIHWLLAARVPSEPPSWRAVFRASLPATGVGFRDGILTTDSPASAPLLIALAETIQRLVQHVAQTDASSRHESVGDP